jgi:hypothetical protein
VRPARTSTSTSAGSARSGRDEHGRRRVSRPCLVVSAAGGPRGGWLARAWSRPSSSTGFGVAASGPAGHTMAGIRPQHAAAGWWRAGAVVSRAGGWAAAGGGVCRTVPSWACPAAAGRFAPAGAGTRGGRRRPGAGHCGARRAAPGRAPEVVGGGVTFLARGDVRSAVQLGERWAAGGAAFRRSGWQLCLRAGLALLGEVVPDRGLARRGGGVTSPWCPRWGCSSAASRCRASGSSSPEGRVAVRGRRCGGTPRELPWKGWLLGCGTYSAPS